MAAASVFPTHIWAILVFLISFTGARAAPETGPSTAELLARIEALEKYGVEQRHRIERQEEHISELKSAIQRQNEHDAGQDKRIAKLQARVQDHEKTIVTLLNHIKTSDTTVTAHAQDEIVDDAEERSQISQTPQGKQEKHTQRSFIGLYRRSRLVLDNGAVAFLVRMNNALGNLGHNQNVRFDTVVTNIGGGYHANHGVFIAPVPGIYIFSTSITSDVKPHNYIEVELEKNGVSLAAAYAYDATAHDQGSVTAVAQLAVNDEVWVRVRWPIDGVVFGNGLSTFTGCLIMPSDA